MSHFETVRSSTKGLHLRQSWIGAAPIFCQIRSFAIAEALVTRIGKACANDNRDHLTPSSCPLGLPRPHAHFTGLVCDALGVVLAQVLATVPNHTLSGSAPGYIGAHRPLQWIPRLGEIVLVGDRPCAWLLKRSLFPERDARDPQLRPDR